MASTNTTKYIGLPQWEAADKPERTDFNTAFSAIDTSLSGKANTTALNGWRIYSTFADLGFDQTTMELDSLISKLPDKSILITTCSEATSQSVTPYPQYESNKDKGQIGMLKIIRHHQYRIRLDFTSHALLATYFGVYNGSFRGWAKLNP